MRLEYPFKNKTTVGIVTCNRPEFFLKAYESIDKDAVDSICVVNSGDKYPSYPEGCDVTFCQKNPTVVGVAKNILLRKMREKSPNAEFFFVMEDDVCIKDNAVFEKYIRTGLESGLIHGQLSFATHGGIAGGNVNAETGKSNKRATVKYDKHQVDFFKHSFAAFTFFHASTFRALGLNLFNEKFLNAAEHLELHYRLQKKAMGTPFYYFADVADSFEYITDQDIDHKNSAIRNNPDFMPNFQYSWNLFKELHGKFPTSVPEIPKEQLMPWLEQLETLYAIK